MAYPHESQREHLQEHEERTSSAGEGHAPGERLSQAATSTSPAAPGDTSAAAVAARWLAASAPLAARLTDPPASWPHATCAGAKVLIVENEDSNRVLMEKILTLVGYQCISACNGQEALEVFLRERPQLVLTDISMPVMDGYEEIARLRALPEGARVPIIAVSAHAMTGDREYALREGCNEYVIKPYRPRDLVEVVDRLLKEASV